MLTWGASNCFYRQGPHKNVFAWGLATLEGACPHPHPPLPKNPSPLSCVPGERPGGESPRLLASFLIILPHTRSWSDFGPHCALRASPPRPSSALHHPRSPSETPSQPCAQPTVPRQPLSPHEPGRGLDQGSFWGSGAGARGRGLAQGRGLGEDPQLGVPRGSFKPFPPLPGCCRTTSWDGSPPRRCGSCRACSLCESQEG